MDESFFLTPAGAKAAARRSAGMSERSDRMAEAEAAEKDAAKVSRKTADQTQAKIAKTADAIEQSTAAQEDSADRRTELAADRTLLASERTYAAWMRTGLGALASGIGARALLQGLVAQWLVRATAVALVAFAIFCFIAGVWREVDRAVAPPRTDVKRIAPWLLMLFSGFLSLVSTAVIISLFAS